MTVYFTKNDDLILFHFDMKNLNMFNFLHIKMMKISFEIIRHHCLVWQQREICIHLDYVCFYVNIHFRSLVQQNVK